MQTQLFEQDRHQKLSGNNWDQNLVIDLIEDIRNGTDGNGYALLKLYNRTNDSKWLERARAFAMHAINQRRFNHSLWMGDMGLACFLKACIDLDDRIPGLEYF